ncbi:hypothetical protein D3C78_1542600 [compost metagenome]
MLIRIRKLHDGHVQRNLPRGEEPGNIRKENRHVVRTSLVHRLANVGPREERVGVEPARLVGLGVRSRSRHVQVVDFDPMDVRPRRHGFLERNRRSAGTV